MATAQLIKREPINLVPEVAIWWSVTITVAIGRCILRATRKGFKLDGADWMMLTALLMYTITLSLMNIARYGLDVLPGRSQDVHSGLQLSGDDLDRWKTFGIMAYVGEICNITTQFLVKGCLLIAFHSLTINRKTNVFNKLVAAVVVLGYFLIIVLFLVAWCHPIEAYWTPTLSQKGARSCYTFVPHNITVLVVNTVTDLLILAIPIPMVWTVKVSPLRRFSLIAIFSIGIFSMIACICARSALLLWQQNHNNSIKDEKYHRNYVVFMAREVSSAVIVGNLYYYAPLIKMAEKWLSRLRSRRSSYREAKSPDIEETPMPERDVEFRYEHQAVDEAEDQLDHADSDLSKESR